MKFSNPNADFHVPDGLGPEEALRRTTHLGIGAHQDDLEFFAIHGILECFEREDRWFSGVTVTDGSGSARAGKYAEYSDSEMAATRREEQRTAAALGKYGAMLQLGLSAREVRETPCRSLISDLQSVLEIARPETVYLHNPADKHDTHVAVLARSLAAIRKLPVGARPTRVYGCEVWRDLDWVPDARKVVLSASGNRALQEALNGAFESQISGGKRYDLAVMGRRAANAAFHESHSVDRESGLTFAVDLTALCEADGPSMEEFTADLIREFASEVKARIARFSAL